MDLTAFDACTFDCYGTLIDWETGILGVMRPLLHGHGLEVEDEEILSLYAELERDAEGSQSIASADRLGEAVPERFHQPTAPHKSYKQVLAEVMHGFRERYGVELNALEVRSLADSVGRWPAFDDTTAALRVLKRYYNLVVVSNIDADLFALTRPKLGVELDGVITAEFVKSYKPAAKHFRAAIALLERSPERVLHIAESRVHDIVPAKAMGFGTVWVNRRGAPDGRGGGTASEGDASFSAYEATPDLEVPDLATLARLVESAWVGKR